MAHEDPKKRPVKRLPALSGSLMFDVTNGKVRARKWPRGRGKQSTPAQRENREAFGAAQRISRFIAPQMYKQIIEATDGTPLLPRDMITMMLYNRLAWFELPDGKRLIPMPYKTDVEIALDSITQTPGHTLIKTEKGWEGGEAAGGGGAWWFQPPGTADFTQHADFGAPCTVTEDPQAGLLIDPGPGTNSARWWRFQRNAIDPTQDFTWAVGIYTAWAIRGVRNFGLYAKRYANNRTAAMLVGGTNEVRCGVYWYNDGWDYAASPNNRQWAFMGALPMLQMRKTASQVSFEVLIDGKNAVQVYNQPFADFLGGAPDEYGLVLQDSINPSLASPPLFTLVAERGDF